MSGVPAFSDFVRISEVDDGDFFAGELFRRKFGAPPPVQGHHFVAFLKNAENRFQAAGYLHCHEFGDIVLVGGGCTDGHQLRTLDAPQSHAVNEAGGILFNLLGYAFHHLHNRCDAFFGHCGNARAEAVDLRAGFVKTEHPNLLVNFHKPLHEVYQRALIAKAVAVGPF